MNQEQTLFDLEGRVALVTGAGQGVGKGIAQMLAAFGASVVVNDYFVERAQDVAGEIEAAGGKAIAVQADVTDYAGVERLFDTANRHLGGVDILVNNAGNSGAQPDRRDSRKPFWDTEPADWQRFLGVNLDGVMNCCRHALPGMVERQRGRLITIISDAGRCGEGHGLEAYSAAKAGAAGLTRGIARSAGRYGITANNIAISATETPAITAALDNAEFMKKVLASYVIRRVGQPTDIAAMALFLASDASSWITGQTYPVNGGFSFSM
ncbi:SDR family NAD(P)-dependent oxidoreductase [Burkholderia lata]|uniref:Short-chain dehydrogenase/reductase SDR n=1 Tax=Burkholderia lata (strain ATCC 17760 / DSM 23089 / LMG 22485 / NCIMB 9086 / R18194 / 383) TaxID=482957 RepID=Q39P27_BURL3|nr:SDR family oxidoreductase [Burkholderia lata]ABB05789.1 Short-chain dehydrogenase/reductase SDR [Burkholderia lata]